MKIIKNSLFIIFLLIVIVISPKVDAATATLSASSTNVEVGQKVKITLNINALAWSYDMSGGVSGTENGGNPLLTNYTEVKEFEFIPTEAKTYTITATCQILDQANLVKVNGADGNLDYMATYAASLPNSQTVTPQVVITATKKEVVTPTPTPTPTPSTPTPAPSTKPDTKKEEKKEDKKEDKKAEKKESKITKFEIEGYKIDFDSKNHEYSIDVNEDTTSLNIKVEGENIKTTGTGTIDITGKDNVKVIVTINDKNEEYTININRKTEIKEEEKEVIKETPTKVPAKIEQKKNGFSIIIPIIGIIASIADIVVLINIFKKK